MSISCSLKTTGSGYEGIEFVLSTSLLELSKELPRIVAGQREPSVAGGGLRWRRWHAYPAPPDRRETLLLQLQEGAPAGRPQLTAPRGADSHTGSEAQSLRPRPGGLSWRAHLPTAWEPPPFDRAPEHHHTMSHSACTPTHNVTF